MKLHVGEIIAYVHANDELRANGSVKNLVDAFKYQTKPLVTKSRVLEVYGI